MKKSFLFLIAVLLMAAAFVGCGDSASSEPAPTDVITETVTDGDVVFEGEAAYYINEVYAEQIKRYHTAISEQWDVDKYYENDMSALPYYYYEGNARDNVGFGFVDLDNDGNRELVIGGILNADIDPTDEATANAIMDSQRVYYTALEYYPYSLYNPQ